jgi:phosphotransferase system enzyme I (PtsI)
LKIKKLPQLGAMIEVPAAAIIAAELAKVCAFFALGTNDLTQYTLAVDRADEKVAPLFDSQHPAVVELMRQTAAAADKAGIPVSVCGEMAGDARQTSLLLGLGLRELSMTPSSILNIKKQVRSL